MTQTIDYDAEEPRNASLKPTKIGDVDRADVNPCKYVRVSML